MTGQQVRLTKGKLSSTLSRERARRFTGLGSVHECVRLVTPGGTNKTTETSMNRSTVALVCLLAAGHAAAGWSMLQEDRDGILYVDREGADKTANGWVAEISQDFHKEQQQDGKPYLSARSRYELDCAAKKIRRLRQEIYPENMAGGGILQANEQPQPWLTPGPGSRDEIIWKSLCS